MKEREQTPVISIGTTIDMGKQGAAKVVSIAGQKDDLGNVYPVVYLNINGHIESIYGYILTQSLGM